MKRIILFLLLLVPFLSKGQKYQDALLYGKSETRLDVPGTLHIPSGCGAPVGINSVKTRAAAIYIDSCAKVLYMWKQGVWSAIGDTTVKLNTSSLIGYLDTFGISDGRRNNKELAESYGISHATGERQAITLRTGEDQMHGWQFHKGKIFGIGASYPPKMYRFNDMNNLNDYDTITISRNEFDLAYDGILVPWKGKYYTGWSENDAVGDSYIYEVDPETLDTTLIIHYDVPADYYFGPSAFAYDSTYLYVLINSGKILKVDLDDYSYTTTTLSSASNAHAMKHENGYLYITDVSNQRAWKYKTSDMSVVWTNDYGSSGFTDDFDLVGDNLWAAVEATSGTIFIIDRVSGASTTLSTGVTASCYALRYFGKYVYALYNTSPGTVVRIDPTTREIYKWSLNSGENAPNEIVEDGQRLIMTTFQSPSKVIRMAVPPALTYVGGGPGFPGSTTLASTNAVSGNNHTHAFAPGGTTAQYIRGNGTLATFPSVITPSDTAAMLAAYIKDALYGLTKVSQGLKVDTALIATIAQVQKKIDSIAGLVGGGVPTLQQVHTAGSNLNTAGASVYMGKQYYIEHSDPIDPYDGSYRVFGYEYAETFVGGETNDTASGVLQYGGQNGPQAIIYSRQGANNANLTVDANAMAVTSDVPMLVGTSGAPNSKAVLDLVSTTKAFLPPRMTAAQRIAISSPATGSVVYDTDSSRLMFYNGSAWKGIKRTDEGGGGGGATDLDGLSDVVITSAVSGNFLRHNGTNWVNTTIQTSDIPTLSAYIQNQFGSAQSTSRFWIDGQSRIDNELLINMADGGTYHLQVGGNTYASGNSTIIGQILSPGSSGSNNFKAGPSASANVDDAVAIGSNATVSAIRGVAIGQNTTASGQQSIAIGRGISATQTNALGFGGNVSGASSLCIGVGGNVTGSQAIGIGEGVAAAHQSSIVIGRSGSSTGTNQLVFGGANNNIADVYIGRGVGSAIGSETLMIQPSNSTGTNIAGTPFRLSGGAATGNAASAGIEFWTGNVGSSGTTVQTKTKKAQFDVDGALNLGIAGTVKGYMKFNGVTSGTITVQPASAAGTYTLTLPTDDGNAGDVLTTDGSGVLSWGNLASGIF